MYLRTILFSTLVLFCASTALAQRPGPQFWRKVGCEPLEPRTKLEAIEDRHSTVVIKGFTRITTVDVRGVRIDAIEMRELGNVGRAKGIVVVLREGGERPDDNRAFVDYEEIDPLLNAIDAIGRVDETATKLAGFEARLHLRANLARPEQKVRQCIANLVLRQFGDLRNMFLRSSTTANGLANAIGR